ncbi:MAG TPA: DUF1810 family protein [Caulobacteraceae bacterium]|nr:DUF1810 family protein [Caulobacteraceae bacterium]
MRVFLDFEASSLGDDSYPIEVAWVFEDGCEESHLIHPASDWSDWDPAAEAIHGIDRTRLVAEGEPLEAVAQSMLQALGGHTLYASAPSWYGKWLSVLLRAAGFPRHALRVRNSDEALMEAARRGLVSAAPSIDPEAAAITLVETLRREASKQPPAHRALADARRERELWLEAGRRAAQSVGGAADPFHLERFKLAQAPIIDRALAELRGGRKQSHWMWFVFPQIAGLGSSLTARTYAISSLAEARAYLADPLLGDRLRACVEAVLGHRDRTAEQIFGSTDALKLRSSLTLFAWAAPNEANFRRALDIFYGGQPDQNTLQRLH